MSIKSTNEKNMAPKSVAANGDWIWTVMLRAAAIRATPTKETQNACAGIQRGTMFAISARIGKMLRSEHGQRNRQKQSPERHDLIEPVRLR